MSIGQTSVKLSTILEHAIRRIGLPAEAQTPEIVQLAKNNLFFILSNFANRGMNLWCVDEDFVPFTAGKARVTLPDGTEDLLNTNFRKNTVTTGTDTTTATSYKRQFTASTNNVLFRLNSSTVATITVSYSDDDVSYTTHSTISHDGTDKWYSLDPSFACVYFKLSVATGTLSATSLTTVSSYVDTPLFRMNRDDYNNLPNKASTGRPVQFWLDRQLDPVIVLWPTPSSSYVNDCVQFYRKRAIADVGTLNTELEIAPRWMDTVIWSLAKSIGLEIPGAAPDRVTMAIQMADKALAESEMEERDNSPVSFVPNISVYSA